VILLDTHAAVWYATDDAALGRNSRAIADAALAEDKLAVCAISFWEIALLIAKRRLEALRSPSEQRAKIMAAGIHELPLTGDIALLAAELENLHGDPADRFIAATAITHSATLMTADSRLLHWRHQLRRQNAAK
jgi:PIN domain nuclease of toxin-antitoxin system